MQQQQQRGRSRDTEWFCTFCFFSLIQRMFPGWMDDYSGWLSMCVILKLCYAAYSLQCERSSDKTQPCDPHTPAPLPITEAQRFKLRQSMDPFRFCSHTSVAIATHTPGSFQVLGKSPSDWRGVMWGRLHTEQIGKQTHTHTHTHTYAPQQCTSN